MAHGTGVVLAHVSHIITLAIKIVIESIKMGASDETERDYSPTHLDVMNELDD